MERDDRKQYNGGFAVGLVGAMQEPAETRRDGKIRPANLHPECVINPVGTKEFPEDGHTVIPRAHRATGMLVDTLRADILPVYTSFKFDEHGKIIGASCEVGEVISAPSPGEGGTVVNAYLTKLAAFRSEREAQEVVYAKAA